MCSIYIFVDCRIILLLFLPFTTQFFASNLHFHHLEVGAALISTSHRGWLPPKDLVQLQEETRLYETWRFSWQILHITRSSWLNCALRDGETVYWVSKGHYEAIAVDN